MPLFEKKTEIGKQKSNLCTDALLVQRINSGDTDAFRELVEKYQNYVYRIAVSTVGSEDDAWDVSQETFLRVYRSLGSFRCDCELSTWLYRVCKNVSYDLMRKRKRHDALPLYSENGEAIEIRDDDQSRDPDASFERKELTKEVRRALLGLPESARDILILRDIEEYSYERIADVLHIELGTVKSRIFRARCALKKKLAENGYREDT